VEYKYVTSRNIVFNHAFESKGGGGIGMGTVQPLHYQVMCPYIYSRIKRKYAYQATE
jgi:hypothetical protein